MYQSPIDAWTAPPRAARARMAGSGGSTSLWKALLLSVLGLGVSLNATPINHSNGGSGIDSNAKKPASSLQATGPTALGLTKRTGRGVGATAQPLTGQAQPHSGLALPPPAFDLTTVNAASPAVLRELVNLGYDMFDLIMLAETADEVGKIIQDQGRSDFDDPVMQDKDWQADVPAMSASFSRSIATQWWRGERPSEECNIEPIAAALQASNIQTTFPPNHCYVWIQDQAFPPSAEKWWRNRAALDPTMVVQKFVYSTKDDAIVVLESQSPLEKMHQDRANGVVFPDWIDTFRTPRSKIPDELPAPGLNAVSDIIERTVRVVQETHYFENHDREEASRSTISRTVRRYVSRLKTIVYQSPSIPKETLEVVKAVIPNGPRPWPGAQFELGSWEFDALIASMAFRDVAWYTAQRKSTFGTIPRAAVRVSVFSGTGDAQGTPSFLWQLADVDQELRDAAQARHDQWLQSHPQLEAATTDQPTMGQALGTATFSRASGQAQISKGHSYRPARPARPSIKWAPIQSGPKEYGEATQHYRPQELDHESERRGRPPTLPSAPDDTTESGPRRRLKGQGYDDDPAAKRRKSASKKTGYAVKNRVGEPFTPLGLLGDQPANLQTMATMSSSAAGAGNAGISGQRAPVSGASSNPAAVTGASERPSGSQAAAGDAMSAANPQPPLSGRPMPQFAQSDYLQPEQPRTDMAGSNPYMGYRSPSGSGSASDRAGSRNTSTQPNPIFTGAHDGGSDEELQGAETSSESDVSMQATR